MTKTLTAVAALTTLAVGLAAQALADPPFDPKDPKMVPYVKDDKRSGYTFAEPETRAMQDDDFTNPGFLWVEKGEKLWHKAEGSASKSCQDCHGKAEDSMKGVATLYPRFDPHENTVLPLDQKINQCRTERMGAAAWKHESEPLLAMWTYVQYQSRGMPMAVQTDGAAAPYFDMGRRLYYTRRGLNDMACKTCHEDLAGMHLRTELLSQGQVNGFPTYRLKWQKLGSVERRIRGCFDEVRAEPYPWGSLENTVLQLYAAWRSTGLPVESPSVRK